MLEIQFIRQKILKTADMVSDFIGKKKMIFFFLRNKHTHT